MSKRIIKKISSCARCGQCCMKGGPTLHREDLKLIRAGHIEYRHLITIRKHEPAFVPVLEKSGPVKKEIIKIAGKAGTWECSFYDKNTSVCSIYKYRPLECRLLECRAPEKLISVIGRNTLKRTDIISLEDPILKLVKAHEKMCSVQSATTLISRLPKAKDRSKITEKLTAMIRKDMDIRQKAVSEFDLSLGTELFYFGRPLFKYLIARGISVHERSGEICLSL